MRVETDTVLDSLSWGEKKATAESFISQCPDLKSRYVWNGEYHMHVRILH